MPSDGNAVKLTPPEETVVDKSKRTVVYHTEALARNEIIILPGEDIERCLGPVRRTSFIK